MFYYFTLSCFKSLNVMCIGVLPTCEGVRSPKNGVTDICKLPRGCWESNQGPLEEAASALNH